MCPFFGPSFTLCLIIWEYRHWSGLLAAFSMQSLYLSTETVQTLLFVVLKWNAGLLLSLATAGFSTTLLREIHQSMKKPRRAPKQELGLIEESNEMSELEKLK